MAKVLITRYGHPLNKKVRWEHAPQFYNVYYMVDKSTPDTEYMCFDNDPKRVIWRKTTSNGVETLEFAYGAWDDRTKLTYVPIYDALEVDTD
jgi:hypothetical protein